MQTSKEKSADHEWTPEEEIQLFYALAGLKPVGVNRHFYVACIAERLSRSLNRDFSGELVWMHLKSMYNLDVLQLHEPIPFPNDEKEFSLPEVEFSVFMSKKSAASEERRQSSDGPPSIIAVATDNTATRDKTQSYLFNKTSSQMMKDMDKKVSSKLIDIPKRLPKRTRGSASLESNSPSTTPPPIQNNKRRRI
uniref:MRG-binding protein n=1 Tax=Glossina brevipalpis TaxID=37001 RepID=A0A1A9WR06_9MUSC